MTEQTRCPACGAPLSAAEQQDVVICDFCNTAIRVIREDDEERFEVLSQPEPQKDVLSQPVDPLVEDVLFGESVPADEPVPASEGTEAPVEGMASFWQSAPEELSATEELSASSSGDTFFAPPPPVAPAPFSETTGGAQIFPPPSTPTTGLGGLPRWAIIVIAVVAVLCLVCVCGVAALFALFMNSGTTTF
jgi:hypothetical protein